MYDFLGRIIERGGSPKSDSFNIDFSKLGFVDPDGMTVLTNALEWLRNREVKIAFAGIRNDRPAIMYMDDCGFFREFEGQVRRFGAGTVRGKFG